MRLSNCSFFAVVRYQSERIVEEGLVSNPGSTSLDDDRAFLTPRFPQDPLHFLVCKGNKNLFLYYIAVAKRPKGQ